MSLVPSIWPVEFRANNSITGFLLGTSIAAAYGYYYLLTTLSTQSTLLNGAISDLQSSTAALQSYISKIDALEKDFKKLEDKVVDKEGIGELRGEFKKVVGGVRGEGLELKERLAGLGMFDPGCTDFSLDFGFVGCGLIV